VVGESGAAGATGATAGASSIGGSGGAGGAGGFGGAGGSGSGGSGGSGGTARGGAPGSAGSGGGGAPPGMVPGLVGVGYGGLRVVSRDGGASWADPAWFATNGGDDNNLLRAVTYGGGLWIATGWKFVTSSDGVNWTDHGMLTDLKGMPPCNIIEGLAYDGTAFYAACTPWNSPGMVYRSLDGNAWTEQGTIGDTQGHLFLSYRAGRFVAYGDSLTTFTSSDAKTWTTLDGVQSGSYCENAWKSAMACHNASWFEGGFLRADWQAKISRSTNGTDFSLVYTDSKQDTLYQSRAIAEGFVSPAK